MALLVDFLLAYVFYGQEFDIRVLVGSPPRGDASDVEDASNSGEDVVPFDVGAVDYDGRYIGFHVIGEIVVCP